MKPLVFKDKLYFTGLVFIVISFGVFLLRLEFPVRSGFEMNGVFLINYLMAIAYFVLLLINGRLKEGRNGLPLLMLFLVISLISCYSLNMDVNVFDDSTFWFCIVLILICLNYMSYGWFNSFPEWIRYLFFAMAGLSFCVFLYLGIYLFPLYIISLPGVLLLGSSLHTYVPVLFCIYTLVILAKAYNRRYLISFLCGVGISILFTTGYVLNWYHNLIPINKHFQYTSITENNGLPGWVDVAQHINKNTTTEKILKTGITYAEVQLEGDFFWRMPQKNFGKRIHDPLVMISQLFCGRIHLPIEDRIKVLESVYDSRHEAQERLWTGEDIHTDQVNTDIRIWPAHHLAYTEMNVILTHAPKDEFWADRQEAIYTFHLPEGGVVTSLSLWINGHEEKGMLTSKGKADTAYKMIVGQERRDPCVLHWQEGNTVSVRVFPILNGQSRKFKVGITTPLKSVNHQMQYENIYFDGPAFSDAQENVSVSFQDAPKDLWMPPGFQSAGKNIYRKTGAYRADWSLNMEAPPVSESKFTFGQYAYQMKPLVRTTEKFHPGFVYLDINASWTTDEANQLFEKLRDKKIFVSEGGDELTEVTNENHETIFKELCKNQFSLFPFYKITRPEESLVITHSGSVSPVMADLKDSKFLTELSNYFCKHSSLRIFDYGTERSPYLKSLKEFRVLSYANGSMNDLLQIIDNNQFPHVEETNDSVALTDADITLSRNTDSLRGNAPDHLMRLFTYNHIMSEAGHGLLARDQEPDEIVDEAQQAYVVSPVSSLIVLETQKDYDRFKITPGDNSLGNASLHSKGSVPEPRDWMIILAVLLICVWIYYPSELNPKLLRK
jgi:XrtN system VIT domain protein